MAEPDVNPSAHTVAELEDEIESIDDPETLREAYEIETENKDRKGAKEALEHRLEAVENATNESGGNEADDSIMETKKDIERSLEAVENAGDEVNTSIVKIQQSVREHAPELISRPLDGIIEVERNEDGGRAVAEFVERRSVPDTQDILGRYEILLDSDGLIHSYRRLNRYRRGDTSPE